MNVFRAPVLSLDDVQNDISSFERSLTVEGILMKAIRYMIYEIYAHCFIAMAYHKILSQVDRQRQSDTQTDN